MRYRALLLDFGGVCLRLPMELHREVEQELGLAAHTFTWMGPVDPATDPLWRAIWAGELTERAYWDLRAEEVSRACGRLFTVREYMRFCVNRPEREIIRAEAIATVRKVRAAGCRVGILTNDLAAFLGAEWKDGVSFFHELDAFTDMSFGIMKPHPSAYETALSALGTRAEETLFVDDQPHNVGGAEAIGMDALRFDVSRASACWAEVEARVLATRRASDA